MSSLVASQQKVASRIEKLVREKRLSEDQLLHLLYIFSREEKVKITRSQNCRLLRLERYGEDTIKKVTQFLDVVETTASSDSTIVKKEKGPIAAIETMSKRKAVAAAPTPTTTTQQQQKKVILRVPKRQAPERLPPVKMPAAHSAALSSLSDESAFSDVSALNDWLVQQTKLGKQARKIDPAICCPETTSTVMSLSDRQIPIKKKRKKTAKKRASQRVKEEEEEEEVEVVIPEEVSIPIAEEDEVILVGEEEGIEELADEEDEGADEADEVDEVDEEEEGDENADEDGADEDQSPAHSVADSDSGDSS